MIYTLTLNPALDRELTVPEIVSDCVLRSVESRVDVGGKGFNVSRQLHSLGVASTALGFLGGKTGEMLQAGLQALGIGTDFVWIPGETRTNISIVTMSGGRHIKVNEPGPSIPASEQAELLAKIEQRTRPGDWWIMAGSLPPGVQADYYARAVDLVKRGGGRVILDTTGEPLRLGCQAGPYLVKPNLEEARALTGAPMGSLVEIAQAARQVRASGAGIVVISRGKDGALLESAEGTWLAHCPRVAEKNPTGAGDALVGGLVWALARGLALPEALGWGAACGAAAASLGGTGTGSRAQVEALFQQARVEPVEAGL